MNHDTNIHENAHPRKKQKQNQTLFSLDLYLDFDGGDHDGLITTDPDRSPHFVAVRLRQKPFVNRTKAFYRDWGFIRPGCPGRRCR